MCVACRGFTVENKQAENPVREGVIEGTLSINQQTLSNCQYMHTFQMDAAEVQVLLRCLSIDNPHTKQVCTYKQLKRVSSWTL